MERRRRGEVADPCWKSYRWALSVLAELWPQGPFSILIPNASAIAGYASQRSNREPISRSGNEESRAAMPDAQRRAELASRIEQRRQELGARSDVSQRLRELSASGSRIPAPAGRNQRSTLNTVIITAIAGVGLLIIAAIAAIVIISGVWVQSQLTSSPSTTVEDFYAAMHQQDYATAYGKFSSAAQSHLTEAKFEQTMRATDLIAGGVQSYTIVTTTTNGQTATVTVDVVRQGNSSVAQVFKLTLTQEQQTWRIATIQQTGQTSAPTPSN